MLNSIWTNDNEWKFAKVRVWAHLCQSEFQWLSSVLLYVHETIANYYTPENSHGTLQIDGL